MLVKGDLDFVLLAIQGKLDEHAIAQSNLSKMSTGRIMDQLASMLERHVIVRCGEHFELTEDARNYLWGEETPTSTRLLRLLDVQPLTLYQTAACMTLEEDKVQDTLDTLQKEGHVVSYPLRTDRVQRVYQTTHAGRETLDASPTAINGIIKDIESLDIDPQKKQDIITRLKNL